jgi:hypothetical protein
MPGDLFLGQLKSSPELRTCHAQGLEIRGNRLFVSCCLYDPHKREERALHNEGFLLSTDLSFLGGNSTPSWKIQKVTALTPLEEGPRITKGLFGREKFKEGERVFPLGHPSGIIQDLASGDLWFAISVYGPHSFSRFVRIPARTLSAERTTLTIPNHAGALLLYLGRYLISPTWGSLEFLIRDTLSEKQRLVINRLAERIDYQDCAAWSGTLFLCGGNRIAKEGHWKKRIGRVHILEVQGEEIDTLSIQLKGRLFLAGSDQRSLTDDLGTREFSPQEGKGTLEKSENHYGDHTSPLTLANEGLAISADNKFLYFLPEDLPEATLIRFELESSVQRQGL